MPIDDLTLDQRPAIVGTDILDGVQLAVDVVDGDRRVAVPDDAEFPGESSLRVPTRIQPFMPSGP